MRRIIISGLLALLLLTGLTVTGCRSDSTSWTGDNWKPTIGIEAEDFELMDLEGQPVRLSELRGKAVIVNFWATWCSPCQHEMPFIQAIYEEWPPEELAILAVNINQSPVTVGEFMDENQYSFPVLLDTDGVVADQYRVSAIPTTLFLDEEGIIRAIRTGAYANQAALEADLDKITGGS